MDTINAFYRFADQHGLDLRITVAALVAIVLLNIAIVVREKRRKK